MKYEIDNEKTIPVLLNYSRKPSTISAESGIINKMTEPIYIMRLYAKEEIETEAEDFDKQRMRTDISGTELFHIVFIRKG